MGWRPFWAPNYFLPCSLDSPPRAPNEWDQLDQKPWIHSTQRVFKCFYSWCEAGMEQNLYWNNSLEMCLQIVGFPKSGYLFSWGAQLNSQYQPINEINLKFVLISEIVLLSIKYIYIQLNLCCLYWSSIFLWDLESGSIHTGIVDRLHIIRFCTI